MQSDVALTPVLSIFIKSLFVLRFLSSLSSARLKLPVLSHPSSTDGENHVFH